MKSKLIIKLLEQVFPKTIEQIRRFEYDRGLLLGRKEVANGCVIIGQKMVENLEVIEAQLKQLGVLKDNPDEEWSDELKRQIGQMLGGTGY